MKRFQIQFADTQDIVIAGTTYKGGDTFEADPASEEIVSLQAEGKIVQLADEDSVGGEDNVGTAVAPENESGTDAGNNEEVAS